MIAERAISINEFEESFVTIKNMFPNIVGLMLAQTGLIVSSYGSYVRGDSGLFAEIATLVCMIPLIFLVFYIGFKKVYLKKPIVYKITNIAFTVQALSIFMLGVILYLPRKLVYVAYLLSCIITLSSWFATFYWLRRLRGASSNVLCYVIFGALILGEPLIYLFYLMPHKVACVLVGVLVLFQFLCRKKARSVSRTISYKDDNTSAVSYFGYVVRLLDTTKLLAVLALSVLVFCFALGFLRGFPDGRAVSFTASYRLLSTVLTMAIGALIVWRITKHSNTLMSVSIWILMQSLGFIALFCYAVFPENRVIGVVFVTVLNSILTGYICYLIVVFETYGKRDAYYFAAAGWAIFLLPRAAIRVTMLMCPVTLFNSFFEGILIGFLILISAQLVFTQFIWSEREEGKDNVKQESDKNLKALLGLDDTVCSDPLSVKKAILQMRVDYMQEKYQLTDRESEVLMLYVNGFTQPKIAEELCISPQTAHSHIKKIYVKTSFHSRQELIECIEKIKPEEL